MYITNVTWQLCALPPCSLLYMTVGQVELQYCWTTVSVLSFHSVLSAAPSLHLSCSPYLLTSLLAQYSHLSCGLPLFLLPWYFSTSALFASLPASILTKWPAHLIRLLANLPDRLHCIPTSFLRSFILLLSTLFVLVIRRTQLFSHTCNFCCCCCYVNATVSRPCRRAGVTQLSWLSL